MIPDVLSAIFANQPLCRHCSNPADFNVAGSLLCAEHTFSEIAVGSASSGEKVTAPADLPPNSMPGSFTDGFDSKITTFRKRALNSIDPNNVQVSSDV